jgi:dihydroorotate dehydrogenase electron transfer subunit
MIMMKDSSAVLVKKDLKGAYVRFTLESPGIAREALPGQFVMVRVSETGHPLLRRPLGIHARRGTTISLFFNIAGLGTELLARKQEGDRLDLLGPLGRGFSLGPQEKAENSDLLVGGGRGIAPLYFLADELHRAGHKVRVLYGARTSPDIPFKDFFQAACWETIFATDDGSFGFRGFVTLLLQQELEKKGIGRLYACGPDSMLKEVGRLAALQGVPAELSLEARMGCGFGACWGCVKKIRRRGREEWLKICEEGPVFQAEEVAWDEG